MTVRQKIAAAAVSATALAAIGGWGFATLRDDAAALIPDRADYERPVSDGQAGDAAVRHFAGMVLKQEKGFSRTARYTGSLVAARRVPLSFQRAGLITEIGIDEGTRVVEGQELAQLDRRHLLATNEQLAARLAQGKAVLAELRAGPRQETIDAAKASVTDLEHQLRQAQLQLERSRSLIESSAIPQQDFERQLYATRALESRLQAAQSQRDELLAGTRPEQIEAQAAHVRGIEAEIQLIGHQLDDCVLQAPFAGTITRQMVDPGAVVAAGTPVFELTDDRNLELHTGVPVAAAARLKPGQTLAARIGPPDNKAGEGELIPLTLRSVLPVMDETTWTRVVIADIAAETVAEHGLVAGQSVRLELEEFWHEPGYWIPATALVEDHSGLWSCLTLEGRPEDVENGSAGEEPVRGTCRKQSVEVLYQRDDKLYVRGTIREGQILLASGIHRAVPGQHVVVEVAPGDARESVSFDSLESPLENQSADGPAGNANRK